MQGRHSEAIAEAQRSLQADPLSLNANTRLGIIFYFVRQYDQAIEQLRKTIDTDPNYWWPHHNLGEAYERKRQYAEAIAELQKARQLDNSPDILGTLGYTYAVSGRQVEARQLRDELKEMSRHRYVSPGYIAEIYLGLGERDLTFEWLQRAYESRHYRMLLLNIDTRLDPLRSDPRFQELLRKVGLPQ